MFDDFGFNSGFDDFSMNDLYYQQDAMQQDLFQQQTEQFQQQQFDSMRQQQDEFQQQVTTQQNQSLLHRIIDFIFFNKKKHRKRGSLSKSCPLKIILSKRWFRYLPPCCLCRIYPFCNHIFHIFKCLIRRSSICHTTRQIWNGHNVAIFLC